MKLESNTMFYKSEEDENTHVLDTTAELPKWRPPDSSPGRVVFLGKTLHSHSTSLHPGV